MPKFLKFFDVTEITFMYIVFFLGRMDLDITNNQR